MGNSLAIKLVNHYMLLRFTKMHGLGNDFVVIEALSQEVDLSPGQIRFIADRHRGIGCDQVLLVEPPIDPEVDFHYRIFNSDGGEVEHCGNGARCFGKFVTDKRLTGNNPIKVSTANGVIEIRLDKDGLVSVDMGAPVFTPEKIPFATDSEQTSYTIDSSHGAVEASVVSMGNPHAVLVVDSTSDAAVLDIGSELEQHPRFPEHVNVGFMEVVSRQQIRLRVYERGVGETQACGTGACAAVVAGQQRGLLDEKVEVELTGGKLQIEWQGNNSPVIMTGPTSKVFEGKIRL